jgi:hypothetical protein
MGRRAWAVVKEWATLADQEVYSAENPTAGRNRSDIAANVSARLGPPPDDRT